MLTDAQIERYGRQILLPAVGGRGQARLLQATVVVVGEGIAAEFAATLLGRAGIGRLGVTGSFAVSVAPECSLERLTGAAQIPAPAVRAYVEAAPPWVGMGPTIIARSDDAFVATLNGRPCAQCFVPPIGEPDDVVAAITGWSIGSLVAAEVLRLLLQPAASARLQQLSTGGCRFRSATLPPTLGCPACR